MRSKSDFSRLATLPCPSHERLALALAAELDDAADGAPAVLELLTRILPRRLDPLEQLDALRALALARLRPRPDGPLVLSDLLREGRGEPSAVATALVVVGRRAGWDVDLVGDGRTLLVAHHALGDAAVLDPAVPALVDPRMIDAVLTWRCAHAACGLVLSRLVTRCERDGDLTRALTASALLLALPVDPDSRAAQETIHGRLLARLN
jgi:hypothetical protein